MALDLLGVLRRLQMEMDSSIEALNYGGCCVFAAAIARKLNEVGVRAEVCTPVYDDETGMGFRSASFIRERMGPIDDAYEVNSYGLCMHHVGVVFEHEGTVYVYDSNALNEGLTLGDGYTYDVTDLGQSLTADEAQALADCSGFWNTMFRRSQIPQVLSLIEMAFDQLENFMQHRHSTYRGPRFVVKHNNGTWKVFDTTTYRDVRPFDTEKQAQGFADRRNAAPVVR